MTLRVGTSADKEQVKALWKQVFGDTDEYVEYFFTKQTDEVILLLEEQNQVQSMLILFWFPVTFPDGTTAMTGYVYALATHPDARGKGHGRTLLAYADHYLQEHGIDGVTTVPAEPSLHTFFGSTGFRPCFTSGKGEIVGSLIPKPNSGDKLVSVSGSHYSSVRKCLLKSKLFVNYSPSMVDYQGGLCRMAHADLWGLEVDGNPGVCAVEVYGTTGVIKELLIHPDGMELALALIHEKVKCSTYLLRTTCDSQMLGLKNQSFGMVKWYDDRCKKKQNSDLSGYLAFGFD